jgi:serine/threonine protein kinase
MGSLPRLQVADSAVPERLGRYEVRDLLGTGGMASVYRAWDPLLNVFRAVKILHNEAASHTTVRQRFVTEASTLTRLVHPNVLRIYEVGEDQGRCWYAMDLVEGGSSQRRIEQNGPFPAADALRITFQVLSALGAAHKAGIVHRDVKPQNVLLREDGGALLSDFGSARQAVAMALTRTGDQLGTIGYMAPEQRADARAAGPAADIYAVGATLYGLSTGRAPLGLFEGELDAMFLARLQPDVREVIRGATRYRPEHRFPSARHMALDIAKAFDRITGMEGPDAARQRWMARFDLLMESIELNSLPPANTPGPSVASVMAVERRPVPVAPTRAATSRRPMERKVTPRPPISFETRPVQAKPTPTTIASMAAGIWAAAAGLFSSWRPAPAEAAVAAAVDITSLSGTWEGRVADVLPLRLELEEKDGGRIEGWVVTTGMRGQVVTRVEGWWSRPSGTLDLREISDRPDSGRYSATVRGASLEGAFHPVSAQSRPLAFTLVRADGAPNPSR